MEFHWFCTQLVLSEGANLFLGLFAVLLSLSYVVWARITAKLPRIPLKERRIRFLVHALNWGVFGVIFLFFDPIITNVGFETWRATARIALFFLMISELSFHMGSILFLINERKSWKSIRLFLS